MNKVLVTGASGFVGFHVVNKLIANNMEVYAAVRKSSKIDHLDGLAVNYVQLNLTDPAALEEQLRAGDYNYIIHIAALTKAKTQQEYNLVNAEYTRNLAMAASCLPSLKKFVFISSLAALGPLGSCNSDELIMPDSTPMPVTAYGRSKVLAEKYLAEFPNLPLVVLRPTAVYGPREKDIFILIRTIVKGLDPYIGRGKQKLSFIYVADLAEIIVRALLLPDSDKPKVYNISDGNSYTRYAMADIVKSVLGKSAVRFHLPLGLVRVMALGMELGYRFSKNAPALNVEKLNELTAANWSCSISNIESDFGFRPAYDLEKGMSETVRWYKDNNWI